MGESRVQDLRHTNQIPWPPVAEWPWVIMTHAAEELAVSQLVVRR
jgi:hypothetical protein